MKKGHVLTAMCFCVTCFAFANGQQYTETLYPHWAQTFDVSRILMEEHSELQNMVIFENKLYGNVLALDGAIQTTEKDAFMYHEMLVHVPLMAHGNAKDVLIVGGGDGGALYEVLRHKSVKNATLVEIDGRVIDLCKKYFPNHSNQAFEDPRAHIVIQDAFEYVTKTKEKFDVIICDTTDPIGPGAILFTPEFYKNCKRILNNGGILVNQCGVPFMQTDEMVNTHRHFKALFKDTYFYLAPVPTYIGGFMCFGWATDNTHLRKIDTAVIEQRMHSGVTGDMRYYTPGLQSASFELPKCLKDALATVE